MAETSPSLTSPNNSEFVASLPEEFRNHPSAAKFKDAGALFKSYTELEKMTGNSLHLPGEDAKPDDWDAFYGKLGRPESPDKYDIKRPELIEGMEWQDALEKDFLNAAHQHGLSKRQAQGILDWFGNQSKTAFEGQRQSQAAAQEELHKEWGSDFDKNLRLAQRGFEALLDDGDKDPLYAWMKASGNHNNPVFLKFFAKIGRLMEEDTAEGTRDSGSTSLDSKSAKEQIAEIRNNPDHPFHHPGMPGHKEALERVAKLYESAYPEE